MKRRDFLKMAAASGCAVTAAATAARIDPLNGHAVEFDLLARFYQGQTDEIEERLQATLAP